MKPSLLQSSFSYLTGLLLIALIFTSCSSNKNFSSSRYQKLKYVDKNAVVNTPAPANAKSLNNFQKKEKINAISAEHQPLMFASSGNDVLVPVTSFSQPETAFNQVQSTDKKQRANVLSTFKIAKFHSYKVKQQSVLKAWKGDAAPAAPSSGKSQLTALLLVLFLGGLGIHRFYLGYTWQGVVQLLTGGGCGIWALIDLIRIIMGDLQPKSGRYSKTL